MCMDITRRPPKDKACSRLDARGSWDFLLHIRRLGLEHSHGAYEDTTLRIITVVQGTHNELDIHGNVHGLCLRSDP